MYKLHLEELNTIREFSWYDFNIPDEGQLMSTKGKREKYLKGIINTCSICCKRKLINNKNGICNSCIKYDTPHRRMFRRVKRNEDVIVAAMNKQRGCCNECGSSLVRYELVHDKLICSKCIS